MSDEWVMAAAYLGNVEERGQRFDRGLVFAVAAYDEVTGEIEVMLHPDFVRRGDRLVADAALGASQKLYHHQAQLQMDEMARSKAALVRQPRSRRKRAA